MRILAIAAVSAALVFGGIPASADSHISAEQRESAVKARKAQMQLIAFYLGTLGGMAKGEIDYDAEAASAAAGSISALATLSQSGFWLPGTDNASMEGTRALPAIWAEGSEIGAKAGAFVEAATAMQAAAGTDLDALRAAMGDLGGSCGGCHKAYRQPNS